VILVRTEKMLTTFRLWNISDMGVFFRAGSNMVK